MVAAYVQIVRSFEHHPKMHAPVQIRIPHWVPMFIRPLWFLIDPYVEEKGTVVDMKKGAHQGELLYTVRFERSGHRMDRNYPEPELEFLT